MGVLTAGSEARELVEDVSEVLDLEGVDDRPHDRGVVRRRVRCY